MPERTAYTLKLKAEVFSLCQVGFALQMEGLAKAEVRPPFLRPEERGMENRASRGQPCFSFYTNTGDRRSLRKGKSSVRIKQVLTIAFDYLKLLIAIKIRG